MKVMSVEVKYKVCFKLSKQKFKTSLENHQDENGHDKISMPVFIKSVRS